MKANIQGVFATNNSLVSEMLQVDFPFTSKEQLAAECKKHLDLHPIVVAIEDGWHMHIFTRKQTPFEA